MKIYYIIKISVFTLTLLLTQGCEQKNLNKTPLEMNNNNQSKEVLASFFNAFGNGDFEGIISVFDDSVKIVAVRNEEPNDKSPYGTYNGIEGLKALLSNLGQHFSTKAFEVDNIIGEGKIAFANGSFTHQLKSTGKLFTSQWSLMCTIENGKIKEYNFYEDSQKFNEANSK